MIRQFSIKALIFLVFLFFFLASGHLYAQTENKNTLELKAEAAGSFDSGNYSDALAQYKSLLQRYPKDGSFSYYCGLSLLNMRKDIPSAIKYLEYASSKSTIPDNVFYYLGEAYNLNYEFVKARKAYEKFSIVASKSESKEMMPSRLAEMSSNAEKMTTSYNLVEILVFFHINLLNLALQRME